MDKLDVIKGVIMTIVALPEVKILLAHIGVNVVVAVSAAINKRDFKFAKISEFLWRKVLPFVLVYAIARLIGDAAGLSWLAGSVFALLETTLVADLVENLVRLGVQIPEGVARMFKTAPPSPPVS